MYITYQKSACLIARRKANAERIRILTRFMKAAEALDKGIIYLTTERKNHANTIEL